MSKTRSFGETPQDEIAKACDEQCPNGYLIACHPGSEEFDALQRMTAKGIDSHLEAIFWKEGEPVGGRAAFYFDGKSLSVFCRRLGESDNDHDWSLRMDILNTLGFEEI